MDPLNIHHVIRHPLSRIETNNFQDKSGCSINGFRSFLFEEGIVRNRPAIEDLIGILFTTQDYRGYPINLWIINLYNFPLSDEILRMKNVQFYFGNQSKPNHKLVSPEPHFVEEERNIIENHFSYLRSSYNSDDIEEWKCFEMDCEGHLVSSRLSNFHLSNESIEHLSNFLHLRNIQISFIHDNEEELITNLSLLSNLRHLSVEFKEGFSDPELLQDLGLFTNLHILSLYNFDSGLSELFLLISFILCDRLLYYISPLFQLN